MKYKYGVLRMDTPRFMYNLGDAMQILAIRNLYQYCGISGNDIIPINVSNLSNYQGDPVVLPVNFPLYGYYDLSPLIRPVYLGASIMSNTAAPGLKMAENEPVGCRDENTYMELRNSGINCYYAGCMTLTLPQRTHTPVSSRVIFVDIPDDVREFIPSEYFACGEFLSHITYQTDDPEEAARQRLQYYRQNAGLIVTSRIHCALPCIASGIPTIFVCDQLSFRYSVLASLLPIYTPEDFPSIDWAPSPLSCEDLKQTMLDYAKMRIASAVTESKLPFDQHCLYQERLGRYFHLTKDHTYENTTATTYMRYLGERFHSKDAFGYILWGITQITEVVWQQIQRKYPNAVLEAVIDEFRDVQFHGKTAVRSKDILFHPHTVMLVTAGAASIPSQRFLAECGHHYYCICYGGIHIEDGKILAFPGQETE